MSAAKPLAYGDAHIVGELGLPRLSLGELVLKKFGGIGVAIVIGIVVIALKFGAGFGIGFLGAKSGAPDVGQCVTLSGSSSDAEIDEADCDDDGVLYEVMSDDGDCDDVEINYAEAVAGKDAVDLCLFWNVDKGECVEIGDNRDDLVDCKAKKGDRNTWKVVSLEDSAKAKCKKPARAYPNVKRDLAYCLSPNR